MPLHGTLTTTIKDGRAVRLGRQNMAGLDASGGGTGSLLPLHDARYHFLDLLSISFLRIARFLVLAAPPLILYT
jgi:hypothetical protein